MGLLVGIAIGASCLVVVGQAGAASASQFTVINGTIRKATGTPTPASGTQASLWGNSSVAKTSVSGSGRVVVGAVGDNCNGWPLLRVKIDDKFTYDTTIVSAKNYGAYAVGPSLPDGTHAVELRFVNDFASSTCDRNVHIGSVKMAAAAAPSAASSTPVPTSRATGSTTTTTTAKPTPSRSSSSSTPESSASTSTTSRTSATSTATTTSTAPTSAAARPSSSGRPGPSNTGVPAGTALTVHQGDVKVTQPGTVIDGMDIRGFLNVSADNVTVRNSIIRGRDPGTVSSALISASGSHRNLRIEDSTLEPTKPTGYIDGIKGHDFTARRVDISKTVDTVQVSGDNVLIQDSWFHDTHFVSPFPQSGNKTHNDNLQIQSGRNIVVEGSVLEGANNSAIQVTQDVGRSGDIRVVDSWLSDGGCTINLAEKGKGPITSTIENNRFGTSRVGNCAIIAPTTSRPVTSGNVFDATGQPAIVRQGQ